MTHAARQPGDRARAVAHKNLQPILDEAREKIAAAERDGFTDTIELFDFATWLADTSRAVAKVGTAWRIANQSIDGRTSGDTIADPLADGRAERRPEADTSAAPSHHQGGDDGMA